MTTNKSTRSPYLIIIVLVILIVTGVFIYMQRPWWCKCGEYVPWAWNVWSSHNSQHLIDFYSPSHIIHGLIFYALLSFAPLGMHLKFALALILESAWEILENSSFIIERYRSVTASLDYSGDTIMNSLSDIGMCAFGFYLASKLPAKYSILLFAVFELTTLYLIRDGLTLNILMLTYPIDSIREWQSAIAGKNL